MNWGNVRLVFEREVRDQMRDRRTLFMIFVLPLLLYPLLGLSFLRVLQFLQEKPFRVMVVGRNELPATPPLLAEDHFDKTLFEDPTQDRLLEISYPPAGQSASDAAEKAQHKLSEGDLEAVLVIPTGFKERLEAFRETLPERNLAAEEKTAATLPRPRLIYNDGKENSRLAEIRLQRVLQRWSEAIGRENLAQAGVPQAAAVPFRVESDDIAPPSRRGVAGWSKILPFILLIWALTGAFYPAVDLCAGEKERGTLETLLISPAERSEIVWGKLFTVMLFSIFTAVLNLLSLGSTGGFVNSQFPVFGAPPWSAMVWLLIALVPIAALFSALCLALAALARSTKEGQYYLMPLMMVITPLVFITMWPSVELTLGFSLIPVTGIVLLLRALLDGEFWTALRFAPPVIFVTLLCCHMAIRWAIDQFSRENVLFRESERLDLRLWLKHVFRDRQATPSVPAAFVCGGLILVSQIVINVYVERYGLPGSFVTNVILTQTLTILLPAIVCMFLFARSPRETIQFRMPKVSGLLGAAGLALCLHPSVVVAEQFVKRLYPISPEIEKQIEALQQSLSATPMYLLALTIAVVPAICEELAFRGVILSGLRHLGNRRHAIVISAIFFGLTHPIHQQTILACFAGLVLGFLAVHSGNIWTPMVFHMLHNGLVLVTGSISKKFIEAWPALEILVRVDGDKVEYQVPIVLAGMLGAGLIFARMSRFTFRPTPEERLYEAIRHDASSAPVG